MADRIAPILLLGVCLAASACTTVGRALRFDEQMEQVHALSRIEGRVDTEGESEGPLVVVLARPGASEGDPLVGVDTFVRVRAGTYAFPVTPGRYRVGAYEDRNDDGLLDPGERRHPIRTSPLLEVAAGERVAFDLRIAADAADSPPVEESLDVIGLVARSPREQAHYSLWAWSVQGAVCDDLRDPAFGAEMGTRGLWEMMDFLNEGRAGIYFLERYDSDRIPVLFVHGISGFPQQLAPLMDALDRERFQPWFYFYPSGFPLDGVAGHLAMLLARLQVQHGFDSLAIVAHSMGGLVSRGAILKYVEETGRDDVRLFVSVSTPWGGDVHAERAGDAPIELPPSFTDMDPSSTYLRWLFYTDPERAQRRHLPAGVDFHMLFGFRMKRSGSRANDGSVSVASQARLEAQQQARTVRALDYAHTEILESPETREWLNALLARRFAR